MLKGEFAVVTMYTREWNGKTYYNLQLKIGNFVFNVDTNADTYLQLQELQRYSGTFSLFRKRSGELVLRLDGVD